MYYVLRLHLPPLPLPLPLVPPIHPSTNTPTATPTLTSTPPQAKTPLPPHQTSRPPVVLFLPSCTSNTPLASLAKSSIAHHPSSIHSDIHLATVRNRLTHSLSLNLNHQSIINLGASRPHHITLFRIAKLPRIPSKRTRTSIARGSIST